MTRVYIAGPMTGHPAYNHAAFVYAAAKWDDAGYEVETPFDASSRVWRRHHGRAFDPHTDRCDWGDPLVAEMLAEDVAALMRADLMALLPGWEKSKGARAEILLAMNVGKEIRDAATFEPLRLAVGLSITCAGESALEEAQRLVHGDRGADYGHPIDDYTRTGRLWGAILGLPDIDPRLCCLMMAAVKISREVNKHKKDNLTDLAGYAECAHMVAERQGIP